MSGRLCRGDTLLAMFRLIGLTTALIGIAHFFVPDAFRELTKVAFPENTDEAIVQNGAIETGIGLAVACRPTRRLGFISLAAYAGWLGFNASKNLQS